MRFSFTFLIGLALLYPCLTARADAPQMSISAGKGGFFLTSPDGDFVIKIRGYIQADSRFFLQNQPAAVDTFVLRRVRPIFEGTVYKYFDFKIMPDFGGGTTVLQEAYFDAKFHPALQVRMGKFKTPFGLERLQSARDLEFVERSQVTNLAPNRDLGIHLFGNLSGGKINYAAGVVNGVADGGSSDGDTGQSKDFVARFFVKPIRGFGAGAGFTAGSQEGTLLAPGLPSYKTSGQQTFFRYRLSTSLDTTTVADGHRIRYSPQGSFYRGPVGVLAEYAFSSQKVRNGLSQATIGNHAWNLTGSFVLTGEPASFEGMDPVHPFDLESGHWGAFEATFRYDQLDVDDEAFPIFADPLVVANQAKNWTLGLNWYLNKNVKFVFNYDQTTFDGGSLKTEELFITRFQLAF